MSNPQFTYAPISSPYTSVKFNQPNYQLPQITKTSTFTPEYRKTNAYISSIPEPISYSNFSQNSTVNIVGNVSPTFPSTYQPPATVQYNSPVRVTFNQKQINYGIPQTQPYSSTIYTSPTLVQPFVVPPAPKPQVLKSVKLGKVQGYEVETGDFKTIKQNQFIGCFHCFSPVTYSTNSGKKSFCG